jgi:hypothetical protein
MMSSTTDIEKTNLESHVELCALRYDNLDKRLTSIESKVGGLQKLIEDSNASMTKVLIGTAGTVIAGIFSVLVVLFTK